MIYEFEVEGDIKGKARPRVNSYTGIVYTPNNTKNYEDLIKQYFVIKYPRYTPMENRIHMQIISYFKLPQNSSKTVKSQMLDGTISPTKKPDIDNIAKIVLDALNKMAFKDDNQITKIELEKKYAEKEKLYIKIEEY